MRPQAKRRPGPRFGKRTRRAMIRLRHALAAEAFSRWAGCAKITKPRKRFPHTWHRWHELGCP